MGLLFLFFASISIFSSVLAQTEESETLDSTIVIYQEYEAFTIPKNFHFEYKRALNRVRRVYPLALHAAYIIDSLEQVLAEEEKNRKKKKIAKNTHKDLKEDFKFVLKDLYISEGVVLSKLIYRETGMTVSEIIEKYKSGMQSTLYSSLASFFDQDLDAKYDPDGEDFVLECVIRDIQAGKVPFDDTFNTLSKTEYKEKRKAYKADVKANKKAIKKLKKKKRADERKK
ncbi:MAG: DUF4294 domain-containing protein [Crocinitomicaceae bacterium]|nr:DUF4294 domain-containing protein [Crocinitomicaceae bacterium]